MFRGARGGGRGGGRGAGHVITCLDKTGPLQAASGISRNFLSVLLQAVSSSTEAECPPINVLLAQGLAHRKLLPVCGNLSRNQSIFQRNKGVHSGAGYLRCR